jgi:hypothetical protein
MAHLLVPLVRPGLSRWTKRREIFTNYRRIPNFPLRNAAHSQRRFNPKKVSNRCCHGGQREVENCDAITLIVKAYTAWRDKALVEFARIFDIGHRGRASDRRLGDALE